ncbi:MAG TPA: glycosyltransferase [Stellaceae bacterium]|nr:glycosyltransferase [Stellaceae bacterium]
MISVEQVILIAGVLAAMTWLYLIAFRGAFWRIERDDRTSAAAPLRSVVAVIPARDEAEVLGEAVTSLLAQDHAGRFDIVIVDDHSTDGTADVARQAATVAGARDRVTVVQAAPVPTGWTGKLWAVRQGTMIASQMRPDYLLLTDADIVHAPDNLRRLIARAESGHYDLVSLMVRLHCRGLWERLLVPAFVFFFFKLYPPRWVADSRRGVAAAAGGCMLLRTGVLQRIGGVDSIRQEIIDDCALARRVKTVGRVWLGIAEDTKSVRPYGSWRPLWDMISRCAFAQLNYSAGILTALMVGMAVTYLAPPLLLLSGSPVAMALGGAAWLAMAASFLPILKIYRCPLLLGMLLPAIAAFYMAATFGSAVQFWRGRGGAWRGRFHAAPSR